MAISIDHGEAERIVRREAELASQRLVTPLVEEWRQRVTILGERCPPGRSATVIAALGTALLAKATDERVDVYSLLDRGEAPHSYSARSLADGVLARIRAELEIDLGANGPNPLNNTPFIGKKRIDDISGVRNQVGWAYFLNCIEEAKRLTDRDASAEALRGFILARSRPVISPSVINPDVGVNLKESELVELIQRFVKADSEGGKRAQAAAAALLDAAYGKSNVIVGRINDPDRRSPLDVSVTNPSNEFQIAIEVKDTPVRDHHIRSSIEKTLRDHHLHNIVVVAISSKQTTRSFDGTIQWAAKRGAKLAVLFEWRSLFDAMKCYAPSDGQVFEGKVFRNLLRRAEEIGVTNSGMQLLRDAIKASDIGD